MYRFFLIPTFSTEIISRITHMYVWPYVWSYSNPNYHLLEALSIPYQKTTRTNFFSRPRRPGRSWYYGVVCRPSVYNSVLDNFVGQKYRRNRDHYTPWFKIKTIKLLHIHRTFHISIIDVLKENWQILFTVTLITYILVWNTELTFLTWNTETPISGNIREPVAVSQ